MAVVAAAGITGGAVAFAGGGDDGDASVTGPEADRTVAAALAETGGGKANAVEVTPRRCDLGGGGNQG